MTAALVVAAMLVAVSPLFAAASSPRRFSGPSYPETGAWFGSTVNASHYGLDDQEEGVLYHEEVIGRKLAFVHLYYKWDEVFPTDMEYFLKDNGQYILLNWSAGLSDGNYIPWQDIASGAHDADIDARAADLKAFGATVFFVFNHEPENDPYGSSAEYISAFQHVRTRFLADGVTNVSFIWALMAYSFRIDTADTWYPGDAYVDAIAADGYNWYACPGRNDPWNTFDWIFSAAHDYAVDHAKPMVVAEFGSNEDPEDPDAKGQWFTDAAATIKSWTELKAVSYFNNGPPGNLCPWFVDSSEESLAAYQAMGADPYFNPPPPLVTIDSAPLDLNISTSATFSFSTNSPGSTFTCQLDAGLSVACTSPTTYSNLAQGDHTFTVFNTDSDSNVGQALDAWTVDTVAPTPTINKAPDEFDPSKTATFKFSSGGEKDIAYTCGLDLGTPVACTSPKTYSNLKQGSHTFTLTATDEAGNVSLPVVDSWTIDTIIPTITITSGPASLSNSKSATFTFTSNELGANFKCSKDGASYWSCTSPKTYNWLSDGAHTVSIKAIDQAGNESVPQSWTWTIDATKPTVTITSGPDDPTSLKKATFTFTASEVGVTFSCQLDVGAVVGCVSPKTYSNLTVGKHTLYVFATDLAGNVSKTAKWTWTIV